MWDRFPETFSIHLLDDRQDLEVAGQFLGLNPKKMKPNLFIGAIWNSCLTGIGLAGGSTTVDTRDGGDPVSDFVGMVIGERHVGKMWGSCWCC
jgi:hypothetical protein